MTKRKQTRGPAANPALRPDARPFALNALTTDQAAVYAALRQRLKEVAATNAQTAPASTRPAFLPAIRAKPNSQVLLIEGARGSGKTSVLLRLLEDLSAEYERQDAGPPVIPVPIIDLQTLRPDVDLLLAVIQGLEPIITAVDGKRGAAGVGPPGKATSRQAWKTLILGYLASTIGANPAALHTASWETAADLSENAHRRRVALPRDFARFMDQLVADVSQTLVRQRPVFLIPIDDADMQPSRLMDLLALLHTLRHPALVYVLTGDERLFLEVFRRHFVSQLGTSSPQATDLTLQTMNKMVPNGQRMRLPPLPPGQRLDRLRDTLGALRFPDGHGGEARSLLGVLERFPPLQASLPSRLRTIADFAVEKSADPFGFAQRLWDASCDQDPEAHAVRQSISIATEPRRIELSRLNLHTETQNISSYALRNMTVAMRQPRGFDVARRTSKAEHREPWHKDSVAAALLAMSLAGDDEGGDFDEFPQYADRAPPAFVGVRSPSWLQEQAEVGWPFPPFESPVALMEMGKRFADFCLRLPKNKAQDAVDLAARGLVSIATQVAVRKSPGEGSAGDWVDIVREARLVTGGFRETYDRRRNAFIRWIRESLLLFAAPESGLSMAEARRLIAAIRADFGEENFADLARLARMERGRRLEGALARATNLEDEAGRETAAASILLRLQEEYAGHVWYDEVDAARAHRRLRGTTALQRFINALGRYRLSKPATNRAAANWHSLGEYFNVESRLRMVLENDWIREHVEAEVAGDWGTNRHAESCIVALWRRGCEESKHPELLRVVSFGKNQLRIAAPPRFRVAPAPGLINLRSEKALISVAASAGGARCELPRAPDEDALSFLLGVARDLYCDTVRPTDDNGALEPLTAFPLVTAHPIGAPTGRPALQPWPSVGWPAPVDWDLLLEGWDATLGEVRELQRSHAQDDEEHILDGLAFRYLQICHAVTQRQPGGTNLNLAVQDTSWKEVFGALENATATATPVMRERIAAFLKRRHLFAAPESGLSRQACDQILASYTKPRLREDVEKEREGRSPLFWTRRYATPAVCRLVCC